MITGTPDSMRILRRISKPLTFGSLTSRITRSGLSFSHRCRACLPSAAPTTVYPSRRSTYVVRSRASRSSSTTSAFTVDLLVSSPTTVCCDRQRKPETRSGTELALHADLAAVSRDDPFHQCKPKAHALRLHMPIALRTVETFEHAALLIHGDAGPIFTHAYKDVPTTLLNRQHDLVALRPVRA